MKPMNVSLNCSNMHDVMLAIVSCDDTYGDMNWDSKTIVTANGLLKSYNNFNFIYSFITTMNCMSVIKPLSIKLQYRKMMWFMHTQRLKM